MPRKPKPIDLDDAIRRYHSGEPIFKLAGAFHVDFIRMRREMIAAGVGLRSPVEFHRIAAIKAWEHRPRTNPAMSRRLKTKYGRRTVHERRSMVAAAVRARRGSKASVEERVNRAKALELVHQNVSPVETALATRLRGRGFKITQQKAIGPYNIDIAVDESRIAVEIFGGHFHAAGDHAIRFMKRSKHLFDLGWSLLVIWVDGRRYPLTVGGDKSVIELVEFLRQNPTAQRQYRVALGNGNPAPVRKSYLNTPSIIKRLGCTYSVVGKNGLSL